MNGILVRTKYLIVIYLILGNHQLLRNNQLGDAVLFKASSVSSTLMQESWPDSP